MNIKHLKTAWLALLKLPKTKPPTVADNPTKADLKRKFVMRIKNGNPVIIEK